GRELMGQISRRGIIGAAAAGGFVAAAEGTQTFADTQQPPFGPALAPLDRAELPSFRFALGAQPSKSFNGGSAKEATVVEFPVSQQRAGGLMLLAPGGWRAPPWHAHGGGWAHVVSGRCRGPA